MWRRHVCGFIPPHILRAIAENGDDDQRRRAHVSLETAAQLRGERSVTATMASLLAVSPGEKRRTVYDAHSTRNVGTRVRSEGEKPVADEAVNEAYDGAGQTYDFYSRVFKRNSIDGRGMRIDSSVHFGVRFDNAMWTGRQMVYGDGDRKLFDRFTKCLDVIGHELTHGVTQHTAALEYSDQAGALNEHFSDVFGMLVKQWTLKQTASKSSWLIGEGIFLKRVNGAAVRSMKAPGTAYDDKLLGKDPQPSHMKGYLKMHEDNGGVHVNSGIPNHAFYLAATLLGGKAWETAGRIWFHTLTHKLRANATFQQCADATVASAGELFGAASAPQHAVIEAWKRVGLDVAPVLVHGGPKLHIKAVTAFEPPDAAAEVPPFQPFSRREKVPRSGG